MLIPQLRDAFHASTGAVAAGIPAYIVPFALLQLVSGTIGERLGRRRVVRTAYVVYAIASVAAALSPTIGVFLALRAAQGSANAFVTPLLLAGLAEITPARRLGEAVGTFVLTEQAGKTTLTEAILYESREARDAVLKSGMEKGVVASYDRLEKLLEKA